MMLKQVMTVKEIEELYELPLESVSLDLSRNKFRKSEIRKSGSTWLITTREAKRVYEKELTFIKVLNDLDWINIHVDEELENSDLYDIVEEWMDKHRIDLDQVKDLYHEGLNQGVEDGKYLSFSQWFYEFKESQEDWK
ncbi:helix-turn-helix domain-containing protein [Bacillus cytotoxicus]